MPMTTADDLKAVDGFLAQAQDTLDKLLNGDTRAAYASIAWQDIEDARYELHLVMTAPVTKTEATHCCVPHVQPDGRAYVAELEARLAKAETVVVDGTKHRMGSGPWLREGHCSCWACSKARLSNGPR